MMTDDKWIKGKPTAISLHMYLQIPTPPHFQNGDHPLTVVVPIAQGRIQLLCEMNTLCYLAFKLRVYVVNILLGFLY